MDLLAQRQFVLLADHEVTRPAILVAAPLSPHARLRQSMWRCRLRALNGFRQIIDLRAQHRNSTTDAFFQIGKIPQPPG
jgi:hypothetical protein